MVGGPTFNGIHYFRFDIPSYLQKGGPFSGAAYICTRILTTKLNYKIEMRDREGVLLLTTHFD
jgi:hypothetical protein